MNTRAGSHTYTAIMNACSILLVTPISIYDDTVQLEYMFELS